MSNTLIGKIEITPPEPRPAESFQVKVLDTHGIDFQEQADATVYINSISGAVQHLQYAREGERTLLIRVVKAGTSDSKTVKINIAGPPLTFSRTRPLVSEQELALLKVKQSLQNPYEVTFTLGDQSLKPSLLEKLRELALSGVRSLFTKPITGPPDARPITNPPSIPHSLISASGDRVSTEKGILIGRGSLGPANTTNTVIDLGSADLRGQVKAIRRAGLFSSFEWAFGDGKREVTNTPSVTHDYSNALTADDEILQFKVQCRAALDDITITRTLVLHSAYAICKRHGTIVPPVKADIYAHKQIQSFYGQLEVTNLESESLTITHQAIMPLSDDPGAAEIPSFIQITKPIIIPPDSITVIGVYPPIGTSSTGNVVPNDAPGFSVYFAGHSSINNKPVRFTHVFEIPLSERDDNSQSSDSGDSVVFQLERPEINTVIENIFEHVEHVDNLRDKFTIQFEQELGILAVSADRKSLEGKNTATKSLARDLSRAGLVLIHNQALRLNISPSRNSISTRRFSNVSRMSLMGYSSVPPQTGPVSEDQICDPDNITEAEKDQAEAQQLVCQLSNEELEVLMPGRFMNGRKGDIILSPGGTGLIGSLLRRVDPPQRYSHSGIMTRNYDEVTHSTASEARMRDDDSMEDGWFDKSDGIKPDIIKWMWPGVITQRVEAAVNGEPWVSPENKTYIISSFSPHAVGVTHNDKFEIVPPLVVKPDPLKETDDVRRRLHAVASSARSDGGRVVDPDGTPSIPPIPSKSHYRLFCYTDPTIGLTDKAPVESGWADGTYPSVCSSFIWMKLKQNGEFLESNSLLVQPTDLESEDINKGADVLPMTSDGLYRYTAAERLAAAQWLYNKLYDEASDKAGWFGKLLTDAPDDLANRVVNTFALDDAHDGKDHDNWRQTRDANAVSPDNILFWDGPDQGRLYGYAEPLIYREPRKEKLTVSRWRKVVSRGRVYGSITLRDRNGHTSYPEGVLVSLYEDKTTVTDRNGQYALLDVPLGSYLIKASKVVDGILYSGTKKITLEQETLTAHFDLHPPSDRYRLVQLYINFNGRDEEAWPWDDETYNPEPEHIELALGPAKVLDETTRKYAWGGELRVEYRIRVALLVDNSVQVDVNAKLYEDTTETGSDLDGKASITFNVPKDQTNGTVFRVTNKDENVSDDFGELAISVKNTRNKN